MRNMSFFLTTQQIRDRRKTVTRRLGWKNLKPGQRFRAVRKAQGLKKGEKIEQLAILECVSNRSEPLYQMTQDDVAREGFGLMKRSSFVSMFMRHMKCKADQIVQRIEFKYVD